MTDAMRDTQATLRRLEALLASDVLTKAEGVSCAGLAEALRRPARVAILGQSAADLTGILRSMLGESVAQVVPGGPALELHHGAAPGHTAVFEDGSSLSQEGYPERGLMRYGPLLLQIEAPIPILASMSFLVVELGAEPESWAPALGWAAKRSEIAVFCAPDYTDAEAAIWSAAPERLSNHCYLVLTGRTETSAAATRARGVFDAVIHAPAPAETTAPLGALKHRLAADIAAARQEDIDAAELFLHRFRRLAGDDAPAPGPQKSPDTVLPPRSRTRTQAAGPAPSKADRDDAERPPVAAGRAEPKPPAPEAPSRAASDREAARALVSAPILHLKRRTRALAEILEWREEDEEWSTEVLEHCCETAEALRDLVAIWPDDDPLAARLRDAIDQACDTVVLLQVESGPGQAEDAARVLYQLRTDFEQALAA